MTDLVVRFDVRFGGRTARAFMAAAMFFATVPELASESVTLTTYYPAPSGVYANLITTGATYLARDGGAVRIGSNVAPVYTLDVTGNAHVSNGMLIDNGLTVNGGETINGNTTINGTLTVNGPENLNGTLSMGTYAITGGYGLTPNYVAWATYGTGAGGAAIYNDNGAYKTLMVVGNNSLGGSGMRNVGVWDNLTASGILAAGGVPPQPATGHYLYATGASCYTLNTNNGSCVGGYYITWAPGVYEDNAAYWWYTGPTPTVTAGTVGQLNGIGWGSEAYNVITFNTPNYYCCAK